MPWQLTRGSRDVKRSSAISSEWAAMRPPLEGDMIWHTDFLSPLPSGFFTGTVIDSNYLHTPAAGFCTSTNRLEINMTALPYNAYMVSAWVKMEFPLAAQTFHIGAEIRTPQGDPLAGQYRLHAGFLQVHYDPAGGGDREIQLEDPTGTFYPVATGLGLDTLQNWFLLSMTMTLTEYVEWRIGPLSYQLEPGSAPHRVGTIFSGHTYNSRFFIGSVAAAEGWYIDSASIMGL